MTADSTPFIKYSDIDVLEIDLYDDAWGFHSEFHDVFNALDQAGCDSDSLTGKQGSITWDVN